MLTTKPITTVTATATVTTMATTTMVTTKQDLIKTAMMTTTTTTKSMTTTMTMTTTMNPSLEVSQSEKFLWSFQTKKVLSTFEKIFYNMLRVLSQNMSNQNSIKASSCQRKLRQKNVNDIVGDVDVDVDVDTEADVMQKRTPPNYWFHVAGKKSMPATTGENWLNWKTLALPSQATLNATEVPAGFFVVLSSGLRRLLHLQNPLHKH